jgi:hypothetical protein
MAFFFFLETVYSYAFDCNKDAEKLNLNLNIDEPLYLYIGCHLNFQQCPNIVS